MRSPNSIQALLLLLSLLVCFTFIFSLLAREKSLPLAMSPTGPTASSTASFMPESVKETIFFLGDTGYPKQKLLDTLGNEARSVSSRATVLFLGDNVYPRGIPPESSGQDYIEAVGRLNLQIDSVRGLSSRVVFIPGNHDWDGMKADGWNAVIRQEHLVETALGKESFLPKNSCPGPVEISNTKSFQIIAINSNWWLHDYDKPSLRNSSCAHADPQKIVKALEDLFKQSQLGTVPVLAMHHPLRSYGKHAYGSEDNSQDMNSPKYSEMIQYLLRALSKFKNIICLAGHDHSLQIIASRNGCAYQLISGTGSNSTPVHSGPDSLYSGTQPGFMRLDRMSTGALKVSILEPANDTASSNMTYSTELKLPPQ